MQLFRGRKRIPAVCAAAAMVTAITASLASAQSTTVFTAVSPSGGLHDIVAGPDGNLWFTDYLHHTVGKMTTGGSVTTYPIPTTDGYPWDLAVGPDGRLWFTEHDGSKIGAVTTGGVFTEYPVPTVGGGPAVITEGPDGNLWFTQNIADKIAKITTGGVVTEYPVPTAGGQVYDIVAGPDGNLWFSEPGARRIGRITTAGAITEYVLPDPSSVPVTLHWGPDGNLWIGTTTENTIWRFSIDGTFTRYRIPTLFAQPREFVTDAYGRIWFVDLPGYRIWSLTPNGGFRSYPLPHLGGAPYDSTLGPDANIWINDLSAGKITRFDPPIPLYEGPPGNLTCSDGFDNDGDGATDAADAGCTVPCASQAEVCNGFDDDCDGQEDEGFPQSDDDGTADCIDPDQDGDYVQNASDNCPTVSNLDQADIGGDGIGDACDFDPVPVVNPPSVYTVSIDGQFEPGPGEWGDVGRVTFLGGAAKVYTTLDPGQQALHVLYDFSWSTDVLSPGDEVGPITFRTGGDDYQVFVVQGGPDTGHVPHPATSDGAAGDIVRVIRNGEVFDNSAGCIAGAVDRNTTSPNYPGLSHNVVELSVKLTGAPGGCYDPGTSFWIAMLPGVSPSPGLLPRARAADDSDQFTLGDFTVTIETGSGTATVSPFGAGVLDHYKCYGAKDLGAPAFAQATLALTDALEQKSTLILKPAFVCHPVDVNGEGIGDDTAHLTCYRIKDDRDQVRFDGESVEIEDRFGTLALDVKKAALACIPSATVGVPSDLELDPFKCYQAKDLKTPPFVSTTVNLDDELEEKDTVVAKPAFLCNPARIGGSGVGNPRKHLACYKSKDAAGQSKFLGTTIEVTDTLGTLQMGLSKPRLTCVPAESSLLP